jgi:hypothetical protein
MPILGPPSIIEIDDSSRLTLIGSINAADIYRNIRICQLFNATPKRTNLRSPEIRDSVPTDKNLKA